MTTYVGAKREPILSGKLRFSVQDQDQVLVASQGWLAALSGLPYLGFLLVFTGLIYGYYVFIARNTVMVSWWAGPLVLFLFFSLFLPVLLYFNYFQIIHIIERVEFQVTDHHLEVRLRPLPWFGARRIRLGRVDHLTVGHYRVRRLHWTSLFHGAYVVSTGGRRRLLYGFCREEDARFVTETLQKWISATRTVGCSREA